MLGESLCVLSNCTDIIVKQIDNTVQVVSIILFYFIVDGGLVKKETCLSESSCKNNT